MRSSATMVRFCCCCCRYSKTPSEVLGAGAPSMIKQFLPSLSCLEVYFVLYIKLQEYRTDSFLLPLQVVVQRAPSPMMGSSLPAWHQVKSCPTSYTNHYRLASCRADSDKVLHEGLLLRDDLGPTPVTIQGSSLLFPFLHW